MRFVTYYMVKYLIPVDVLKSVRCKLWYFCSWEFHLVTADRLQWIGVIWFRCVFVGGWLRLYDVHYLKNTGSRPCWHLIQGFLIILSCILKQESISWWTHITIINGMVHNAMIQHYLLFKASLQYYKMLCSFSPNTEWEQLSHITGSLPHRWIT